MSSQPRVVLLSGSVGAGKSAVLDEIHNQLCMAEISHACIDVDALRMSWPPHGSFNGDLATENLRSVWRNFASAWATRLVVAGVVETQADVAAYEAALESGRILVCQLQASSETRRARIAARERGSGLTWHLNRTDELQAQLDALRLADFEVSNDGRAIQEVAAEVLCRVHWLAPSHPL